MLYFTTKQRYVSTDGAHTPPFAHSPSLGGLLGRLLAAAALAPALVLAALLALLLLLAVLFSLRARPPLVLAVAAVLVPLPLALGRADAELPQTPGERIRRRHGG